MRHDDFRERVLLGRNHRTAGDHRSVVPAPTAPLKYPDHMTTTAKMTAQPVPKTVRIRANLAALGLRRGQETDTALTPMIQGAIDSGVLSRLDVPEPEAAPEPKAAKTKRSGGANGNDQV